LGLKEFKAKFNRARFYANANEPERYLMDPRLKDYPAQEAGTPAESSLCCQSFLPQMNQKLTMQGSKSP